MSDIDNLVNEYNAVEKEQAARLRTLFYLLKPRHGWRYAKFANGVMWSNCWDMPAPHLDEPQFAKLTTEITEVLPGE